MPPTHLTPSSSVTSTIAFPCPMFIEDVLDPILRFARINPTICNSGRVYGAHYIIALALEYALLITVLRIVWKCFSYFGWWRAVWREINGTREELGLMAEEEW